MRNALREILESIRVALCKVHQFEFSAPWNPRQGGC